jgi:hypothetical protein
VQQQQQRTTTTTSTTTTATNTTTNNKQRVQKRVSGVQVVYGGVWCFTCARVKRMCILLCTDAQAHVAAYLRLRHGDA